jgi:hypothetical protein
MILLCKLKRDPIFGPNSQITRASFRTDPSFTGLVPSMWKLLRREEVSIHARRLAVLHLIARFLCRVVALQNGRSACLTSEEMRHFVKIAGGKFENQNCSATIAWELGIEAERSIRILVERCITIFKIKEDPLDRRVHSIQQLNFRNFAEFS